MKEIRIFKNLSNNKITFSFDNYGSESVCSDEYNTCVTTETCT